MDDANGTMNRLYVVEPMPTPTGTKADHRLALRASDIEEFAWALAISLGIAQGPKTGENHDIYKWLGPIARDLQNNKGASIVIAGEQQPPIVHALAAIMNEKLGNFGKTVFHTDPIEVNPTDQLASLLDLVKDLDAGAVDVLIIIGGNPAFNSPVELGMRDRLKKAKLRIRLGLYSDETSQVCQWQMPEAHSLETWGDARAFDGTVTIQQPLIQPLYGGRSAMQLLQSLTDQPEKTPYEIVKSYWNSAAYGRRFRSLVAARRARRHGARYGAAGEGSHGARRCSQRARRREETGRQAGSDLPARPHDLRRPLRQQRMAAGTAEADHQAHLG